MAPSSSASSGPIANGRNLSYSDYRVGVGPTHTPDRLPALLIARLRLLAAALICLCAAAPAEAAKTRVPRDFVGVTAEDVFAAGGHYRALNMNAQRRVGIRTIRQTFDQTQMQRFPGFYDRFVLDAAAQGVGVLPILFRSVPEKGTPPPASNAAFADFAARLARRYGPSGSLWDENPQVRRRPIRAWQIWNEPNLAVYWKPWPSAPAYVALLRATKNAIESVDPGAEIVTAGIPPSKLSTAIRFERFLRRMYKVPGAKAAFDTMAINAYARNNTELATTLRTVRKIMNRAKDRKTRIWITELGWATGGPAHRFNVGEYAQSVRIQRAFTWVRRNRRRLRLRGFVYYSWRDAAPYPPEYKDMWGLHTGLLTQGGAPKPSLFAFASGARRLR